MNKANQQYLRILYLSNELRKVAAPVGPMHSFWDVISDMHAFTQGKPTIVQKTVEEWIGYAEALLAQNQ